MVLDSAGYAGAMPSLAYTDSGPAPSGETVVLVHGLASSKEAWRLVIPLLAPYARVIAVDLPGHGASPAVDADRVTPEELAQRLDEFLAELGVDRAHLVGNSMGGWVVLDAAANGRAASVVGLCPAGLWNPDITPGPLVSVNHILARSVRPAIPALLHLAPLRWLLVSAGVQRPIAMPYEVAVEAAYAQADASGFQALFNGMAQRAFERAGEIDDAIPVTIAFGDHDRILNARHCQRRDLAPTHAKWLTLWRCGHAPMYDTPTVVRDLVLEAAGLTGT